MEQVVDSNLDSIFGTFYILSLLHRFANSTDCTSCSAIRLTHSSSSHKCSKQSGPNDKAVRIFCWFACGFGFQLTAVLFLFFLATRQFLAHILSEFFYHFHRDPLFSSIQSYTKITFGLFSNSTINEFMIGSSVFNPNAIPMTVNKTVTVER